MNQRQLNGSNTLSSRQHHLILFGNTFTGPEILDKGEQHGYNTTDTNGHDPRLAAIVMLKHHGIKHTDDAQRYNHTSNHVCDSTSQRSYIITLQNITANHRNHIVLQVPQRQANTVIQEIENVQPNHVGRGTRGKRRPEHAEASQCHNPRTNQHIGSKTTGTTYGFFGHVVDEETRCDTGNAGKGGHKQVGKIIGVDFIDSDDVHVVQFPQTENHTVENKHHSRSQQMSQEPFFSGNTIGFDFGLHRVLVKNTAL